MGVHPIICLLLVLGLLLFGRDGRSAKSGPQPRPEPPVVLEGPRWHYKQLKPGFPEDRGAELIQLYNAGWVDHQMLDESHVFILKKY